MSTHRGGWSHSEVAVAWHSADELANRSMASDLTYCFSSDELRRGKLSKSLAAPTRAPQGFFGAAVREVGISCLPTFLTQELKQGAPGGEHRQE